jgi:hypothetical protein
MFFFLNYFSSSIEGILTWHNWSSLSTIHTCQYWAETPNLGIQLPKSGANLVLI